jgi:hypothetical protein
MGQQGMREAGGAQDRIFSASYADYSSGSTPFGEIAAAPKPPYTGRTLVLDSLAGGSGRAGPTAKCAFWLVVIWPAMGPPYFILAGLNSYA